MPPLEPGARVVTIERSGAPLATSPVVADARLRAEPGERLVVWRVPRAARGRRECPSTPGASSGASFGPRFRRRLLGDELLRPAPASALLLRHLLRRRRAADDPGSGASSRSGISSRLLASSASGRAISGASSSSSSASRSEVAERLPEALILLAAARPGHDQRVEAGRTSTSRSMIHSWARRSACSCASRMSSSMNQLRPLLLLDLVEQRVPPFLDLAEPLLEASMRPRARRMWSARLARRPRARPRTGGRRRARRASRARRTPRAALVLLALARQGVQLAVDGAQIRARARPASREPARAASRSVCSSRGVTGSTGSP